MCYIYMIYKVKFWYYCRKNMHNQECCVTCVGFIHSYRKEYISSWLLHIKPIFGVVWRDIKNPNLYKLCMMWIMTMVNKILPSLCTRSTTMFHPLSIDPSRNLIEFQFGNYKTNPTDVMGSLNNPHESLKLIDVEHISLTQKILISSCRKIRCY